MAKINEIYSFLIDKSKEGYDVLIVTAPTGSGKTTGAIEFALSRPSGERVVFMTPTKATTYEFTNKITELARGRKSVLRDDSDVKVSERITSIAWLDYDIIVTTYERAVNVLSKKEFADVFFSSGKTWIVIDEFHNVTDPDRTFSIQTLMALSNKYGAPLILLSATFPELDGITEKFRSLGRKVAVLDLQGGAHVEVETIATSTYCDTDIYKEGCEVNSKGMSAKYYARINNPIYVPIAEGEYRRSEKYILPYVLSQPKPILIFVPNRRRAEELATEITSKGFPAVPFHSGIEPPIRSAIQNYFYALARGDKVSAVPFLGVIKKYFRHLKDAREISVIVATHSLSQGVNLLVETVVIPYLHMIGRGVITPEKPSMVAQMAGRAGRFSGRGKAIVIYDPYIHEVGFHFGRSVKYLFGNEKEIVEEALEGRYEKIVPPSPKFSIALYLLAKYVFGGISEMKTYWYPDDERFDEIEERILTAKEYVDALPLEENGQLNDLAKALVGAINTSMLDVAFLILEETNRNIGEYSFDVLARRIVSTAYFAQEVFVSQAKYAAASGKLSDYFATVDSVIASLRQIRNGDIKELVNVEYEPYRGYIEVGVFGEPFSTYVNTVDPELIDAADNQLGKLFVAMYAAKGNATIGSAALRTIDVATTILDWAVKEIRKGRRVTNDAMAFLEDEERTTVVRQTLKMAKKVAEKLYRSLREDAVGRAIAALS